MGAFVEVLIMSFDDETNELLMLELVLMMKLTKINSNTNSNKKHI